MEYSLAMHTCFSLKDFLVFTLMLLLCLIIGKALFLDFCLLVVLLSGFNLCLLEPNFSLPSLPSCSMQQPCIHTQDESYIWLILNLSDIQGPFTFTFQSGLKISGFQSGWSSEYPACAKPPPTQSWDRAIC